MGRKAVGPVCCVMHVKEPRTLIVKEKGLAPVFLDLRLEHPAGWICVRYKSSVLLLLHIAFIDLTKALDLISRDSLFSILIKRGCLPFLFKPSIRTHMVESPSTMISQSLSTLKRCQAGMCPRSYPLWDLFCCSVTPSTTVLETVV